MKFKQYLTKLARKEFLKEGHLWKLLFGEVKGYEFNDDSITVYFKNRKSKELKNIPHSMEYLYECHSCGYHINHRSSQKKVKMPVHTIEVTSYVHPKTTLKIVTTNENIYDYIEKQYKAVSFIKDNKVVYGDKSIVLKHAYGFGMYTKKVKFKNILEYNDFEEIVTLEIVNENDD